MQLPHGGTEWTEFPQALMPTPEFIKQVKKAKAARQADQTGPKPTKEQVEAEAKAQAKEFGEAFASLVAFQVAITNGGGEFVYAGEGVKLGDKTTPVLWYKGKDAKQYTVIYGDLHTEQSDKAPSLPTTNPAGEEAKSK